MTALPTWDEVKDDCRGSAKKPSLLLGNGFSIAFAASRFSYGALLEQARNEGHVSAVAESFFEALQTQDFEQVIKSLQDARRALVILDASKYASEIARLDREISQLKEALATVLAGLHPERPYDVDSTSYLRVRQFIDEFARIYTANYDLLLYWALMQDLPEHPGRTLDDGFRSGDAGQEYVLWDHLSGIDPSLYFLHGGLHLYRGEDGLRKLTWVRTDIALIDQIRAELSAGRYPLYVTEGTSQEKLMRIQEHYYLTRGLRSLANIGGVLVVFGLSLSTNDRHILNAIQRSKVTRIMISIFGDPQSESNQEIQLAASQLSARMTRQNPEVVFFDAASVPLW